MKKKDNDIGNRIKYAREYRNLTLKQLAEKCAVFEDSITYNSMWQWEVGRRKPKYEIIKTIAHVLEVQSQYFLPGEHFDDPIELIQPYLLYDESIERLGNDIMPPEALKNRDGYLGYIKTNINVFTNDDLIDVVKLVNKKLKKPYPR